VPVDPREAAVVRPLLPAGEEDPAAAPAPPGVVCPSCPDASERAPPATAPPPAERVESAVARVFVPKAEPPATVGAPDCEVGPADAADAVFDPVGDGSAGCVPSGVLTVGVRTGALGSDGVLADGVVRLGVLTCGLVTGPTVTGGTVTDGTLRVGTLTVGLVAVGTLTVGTVTAGTLTVGTLTVEADTAGLDAAATDGAAAARTPHAVSRASVHRLVCRVATRVEVAHRPATGLLHSTGNRLRKKPPREITPGLHPLEPLR
jgi:hypothetical protein